MTTKRLVVDLMAFVAVSTFLLFFIPWSLNATDSLTNALGVGVIVALVIGIIAVVHKKFTQTNEDRDDA